MDQRLRTILSNVLKLKPEEIRPEVSRDTCKAWTSLAHLLLVTQIESAFGIQLSTQQVVGIRTVADVESVVHAAAESAAPAARSSRLAEEAAPERPSVGRVGRGVSAAGEERRWPAGIKPVALVTGSGRGIGAEAARALARRGFAVIVHYLAQEGAAKMVQEALVAEGVDAILVQADIQKREEILKLHDVISKRWGRLDVLVNNAAPPVYPAPVETLSPEQLHAQLNAHVHVPLLMSQTFLPMLKKSGGAIVNVLSIFIHDTPPEGLAAYVAAKSALAGLTRSMAREWTRHNVRVNAISPAVTRTALSRGMDPATLDEALRRSALGRPLDPADVGEAIARLACAAGDRTGAEVILDGAGAPAG